MPGTRGRRPKPEARIIGNGVQINGVQANGRERNADAVPTRTQAPPTC